MRWLIFLPRPVRILKKSVRKQANFLRSSVTASTAEQTVLEFPERVRTSTRSCTKTGKKGQLILSAMVKTKYGNLLPCSGASDYRKKHRCAVSYFESGSVKSQKSAWMRRRRTAARKPFLRGRAGCATMNHPMPFRQADARKGNEKTQIWKTLILRPPMRHHPGPVERKKL